MALDSKAEVGEETESKASFMRNGAHASGRSPGQFAGVGRGGLYAAQGPGECPDGDPDWEIEPALALLHL
jgi:hypothetical protein